MEMRIGRLRDYVIYWSCDIGFGFEVFTASGIFRGNKKDRF